MFGNSKSNKPQNRIDCLIGAGTTIEGSITFSGGLRSRRSRARQRDCGGR